MAGAVSRLREARDLGRTLGLRVAVERLLLGWERFQILQRALDAKRAHVFADGAVMRAAKISCQMDGMHLRQRGQALERCVGGVMIIEVSGDFPQPGWRSDME